MAALDRDTIQEQEPLLFGMGQPDPINCQRDYSQIVPLNNETQEKLEYLSEAFEEVSSTQESESTEDTRTCNSKCCKDDPFKFESIKKAKQIGIKIILKNVLRKLFDSKACKDIIIREIFIYLSIVILLVSTSFSLVSIIHDIEDTTADKIPNKTNKQHAEKQQILKTFDYISFGISVFGSLFPILDFLLYVRHRGCRVLKRTCTCQELVQPGDEENAECFNDGCAYCEGTCGKGCTAFMDIVRIVVLETIFFPNLLLKLFKMIVILVDNNNDFNSIHPFDWFMASLNFVSIILFVYLQRAYIFFGVVRSIRKLKTRVNKKCQGIMFIVTFFMYMCALMLLQFLMIIIIVVRFHHEYTQKNAIENSWQLWYMMIFTYLMPLIGMAMFFFVHQFWTSKLPVDVIRDLMSELQTKGKRSNRNKNKTETTVEQVMNYLGDQFTDDYNKLNRIPFYERFLYPFFSPARAVVSSLYVGVFAGFFISSMYNGSTDWLGLHIAVAILASSINVYAASVGIFCPIAVQIVIMLILQMPIHLVKAAFIGVFIGALFMFVKKVEQKTKSRHNHDTKHFIKV